MITSYENYFLSVVCTDNLKTLNLNKVVNT